MSRVEVWLTVPVGDQRGHARTVLRRAAADVLGVGAGDLVVSREQGGRPCVVLAPGGRAHRPLPPVGVSVSHTRGLTAVAVATGGAVGVDVEAVRDLPAVPLARRWFGAEEADWVESHDAGLRSRALLWVWTHKEALGKVRGTGLARGGRLLPVPLPAGGVPGQAAGQRAKLREVSPGAGLTSAVPRAPGNYLLCVAGGRGTDGAAVRVRSVAG